MFKKIILTEEISKSAVTKVQTFSSYAATTIV